MLFFWWEKILLTPPPPPAHNQSKKCQKCTSRETQFLTILILKGSTSQVIVLFYTLKEIKGQRKNVVVEWPVECWNHHKPQPPVSDSSFCTAMYKPEVFSSSSVNLFQVKKERSHVWPLNSSRTYSAAWHLSCRSWICCCHFSSSSLAFCSVCGWTNYSYRVSLERSTHCSWCD